MPLSFTHPDARGPVGFVTRPALFHTPVFSYTAKVLNTGPIAYWVQGEAAGATAVDQVDSPAQDGTYVGVTLGQPGIGDGNTAPLYDGINDYTNVHSAALNNAFDGQEGTLLVWARVSGIGVWTDGAFRTAAKFRVDANNRVFIRRDNINNQLRWFYEANTVVEQHTLAGLTTTDWMQLGITWDVNAGATGEVRFYYNGAQTGATSVNLGAWAGNLNNTFTVVGAGSTGPAEVWDGYAAHCALYDRALPPATVADLYGIP